MADLTIKQVLADRIASLSNKKALKRESRKTNLKTIREALKSHIGEKMPVFKLIEIIISATGKEDKLTDDDAGLKFLSQQTTLVWHLYDQEGLIEPVIEREDDRKGFKPHDEIIVLNPEPEQDPEV
jgi:hypothetical protein